MLLQNPEIAIQTTFGQGNYLQGPQKFCHSSQMKELVMAHLRDEKKE
jgi:hypothetical protein